MKRTRKLPAHRLRCLPPFFHPVPLRSRRDGWTVRRQCHFLAQLYFTGSVREAPRRVGMSRATAYRLRARVGAEGFAAAWDHVLTPPGVGRLARQQPDFRKVTLEALLRRAETGLVQPVLYRGEFCAIREKPDNSALFRLLGRADALAARGAGAGRGRAAKTFEKGVVSVKLTGCGRCLGSNPVAPAQAGADHAGDELLLCPMRVARGNMGCLIRPVVDGPLPAQGRRVGRGGQQMPHRPHGNGTTRVAGLTARAECGPSRQTKLEGSA